jgi:hypothetical protein
VESGVESGKILKIKVESGVESGKSPKIKVESGVEWKNFVPSDES